MNDDKDANLQSRHCVHPQFVDCSLKAILTQAFYLHLSAAQASRCILHTYATSARVCKVIATRFGSFANSPGESGELFHFEFYDLV